MNENSNAAEVGSNEWKRQSIRNILIAMRTPKEAVDTILDRFGSEIDGFDNWRSASKISEFTDTLRERYFMEDEKDACTCGTPWSGIHESMCPCFNASEQPGDIVQAEPCPKKLPLYCPLCGEKELREGVGTEGHAYYCSKCTYTCSLSADPRSELQKERSESDGERYRLKGSTLEVDAIRWMGSNTPAVLNFGKIYHEGRKDCPLYRVKPNAFFPTLSVDTGEGYAQVNCGDWVIRDSSQEFAVVPDASFQKTYEPKPKQNPQVLQVYREMLARWELSTCYLVSFIEHNYPCGDRTEGSEWAAALKSLKEMQETLGGRLKPNPEYFNPGPDVFEIQPNVPKIENPTYDMSIHSNPDARAWAKEFIKTLGEIHAKLPPDATSMIVDEEWIHGWFANAMMAMHDHLKRQEPGRELDALKADINEAVKGMETTDGTSVQEINVFGQVQFLVQALKNRLQCIDELLSKCRDKDNRIIQMKNDMEEREISHYAQAAELARQICVHNFQPEAQGWDPLNDLPVVLIQISNMAAGMSAKIAKLEQEIETLRAQKPE